MKNGIIISSAAYSIWFLLRMRKDTFDSDPFAVLSPDHFLFHSEGTVMSIELVLLGAITFGFFVIGFEFYSQLIRRDALVLKRNMYFSIAAIIIASAVLFGLVLIKTSGDSSNKSDFESTEEYM